MLMSITSITENISMIDSPFHGETGLLSTYVFKSGKNAIIDPGPSSQTLGVLQGLKNLDIKDLKWILLTHIHLDHSAGSWKIIDNYPDAKVHCHPRGTPHMIDPSKIVSVAKQAFGEEFSLYGEIRGLKKDKVVSSIDNQVLEIGGVELMVIWTPGHSTHSQTYYEPESRIVFVGDSAGHIIEDEVVIPASPPPFNPEDAVKSLNKLIDLGPEIICYSHFGYKKEAVKRLKEYRKQVELWNSLVREGVEKGLTLREVYNLVSENDPMVTELLELLPDAEKDVYQSLNGFYGYARWKLGSS